MIEKSVPEFIADAENLFTNAAANDDYVKIITKAGNAILISESEWNILIDALNTLLALSQK